MLRPSQLAEIMGRYAVEGEIVGWGRAASGEQGEVWRLTTTAGEWAVKRPFQRLREADVRESADFQAAALAAGIPSPAITRTVDGDVLTDIGGCQVRVHQWADLADPDAHVDPGEVGRLVAWLHRVPFDGCQPLGHWYTDPVGAPRWDELARLLEAAEAPFAGQLAAIRDELIALEGLLEAPAVLQTCHRDLWADNLRPTLTGGLCIIDWDDSGLADPTQELGLVLYQFAYADPARAQSLYGSYLDAGGPARINRPGSFSMVIAQLGHINERACRRWLDPKATEPDRLHACETFGEHTAQPLSRALINETLHAISHLH